MPINASHAVRAPPVRAASHDYFGSLVRCSLVFPLIIILLVLSTFILWTSPTSGPALLVHSRRRALARAVPWGFGAEFVGLRWTGSIYGKLFRIAEAQHFQKRRCLNIRIRCRKQRARKGFPLLSIVLVVYCRKLEGRQDILLGAQDGFDPGGPTGSDL